ncbi:histidine kinase [Chitiniphilus shinanonensis]|uniref:histidine kinase n=1 Tax=Chitiniphilus shinanonensis TaxID=553088 RepID=A0ABQ6BRB4_9NEIS|nr:HAMP domain-containing sensor histidine kinase [Chitiniphilus shinanonensis]GLS03872.1 histidine kinase [Chitiniphilus shinanonensis]
MEPSSPQPDLAMILASSVHDMKNSLGLMGRLLAKHEAVWEGISDEAQSEYSHLLYEVNRMNANLISLLTLYKLGKALYPFDPQPWQPAELCEEVAMQHRVLLSASKVALQIDVPEDLVWHYDTDLIAGVLGQALTNAINYTTDTVRLAAGVTDDELWLAVEDNGRGYPPQMLLDSRHAPRRVDFSSGSTGLGLYFAEHVAQLHRNRERVGSLRLENGGTLGGGRFVITLP